MDQSSQLSAAGQPTTELAELFLNLHSVNTHLMELSMLLRREHPRNTTQGPMRADIDAGPDVVDFARNFPRVTDRPWLAERLTKLVAQRRHWIISRQKTRQATNESNDASSTERAPSIASEGDVAQSGEKRLSCMSPGCDESFSRSEELVQHSRTHHSQILRRGNAENSSRILLRENFVAWHHPLLKSTQHTVNDDSVRTLPKLERLKFRGVALRYNTKVECPFCRTTQLFKDEDEWE